MSALRSVLARLREPSTMAGLSALAFLFGIPAGLPEAAMQIAAGAAALLAVCLPERGKPPQQ